MAPREHFDVSPPDAVAFARFRARGAACAGDAYGIRATPTTFVVAHDGTIVGRAPGPRPWTGPDARALFGALLAPSR